MELKAGDQVADYRIIEVGGRGSSGTVYRAAQESSIQESSIQESSIDASATTVQVAIKIAHRREPDAANQLVKEAKLLERLRHRNLISFRELVDDGAEVALVTSWVSGPSLAELLESGPLPIKRTMVIARQLADVLDYLHNMGVVHRDLSPANVLIGPGDTVTLIDLGLGRTADGGITTDISLAGTPRYMAPEVIQGQSSGPFADQYSVAAILHEMIAGQPWVPDSDVMATVLHHQLSTRPEPLSEIDPYVPASVEAAVLRGLNKEPAARFGSVSEMIRAAAGDDMSDGSIGDASPADSTPGRGGVVAVLGILLLAALGLGSWFLLGNGLSLTDSDAAATAESLPDTPANTSTSSSTSTSADAPASTSTSTSTTMASGGSGWPVGTARALKCNLLQQPDFDTGTLPVDYFGDPPGGERMLARGGLEDSGVLVVGQADQFGLYAEAIEIVPGTAYTFVATAGPVGEVYDAKIGLDWLNPSFGELDDQAETITMIDADVATLSVSGSAPPGAAYAVPWIFKDGSPGVVFADELVFAPSSCSELAPLLAEYGS